MHLPEADALDKVDPKGLARGTAALAWLSDGVTEMPGVRARPEAPASPRP